MSDKPRTTYQMLRDIDDAGLDVYEFRLWCHIWRVGVSWESVRTMAKKCGMSVGMVSQARKSLMSKNLLTYEERKGRLGLTAVLVMESEQPQPVVSTTGLDQSWSYSQYAAARQFGKRGEVCIYCGQPEVASFDHWFPRSRGGTNEDSNLVPSCSICNNAKGTMTGDEFIEVMIGRKWLIDDRSHGEQLQQLDDVSVHDVNGVFTTRTSCSPHEQDVHHMNAILSNPLEESLLKGEGDRANGNGRRVIPPPPIVITQPIDRTPGRNGYHPPEEPPVEKRPPSPEVVAVGEMCNAITDVTGISARLNWDVVSGLAGELVEAGYLPEQLRRHYSKQATPGAWNWYDQDWRGKKGELPSVKAIRETIAGATQVAAAPKKIGQIERALAMFGNAPKPATS